MKKSKIKSTKQLVEALAILDNGSYTISVWSKLFKQKVQVEFYDKTGDMSLDITDYALDCFNMIFDLDKDENLLDDIKNAIWNHFNALVAETSYSQVPKKMIMECDGNEELATRKYFGIQSPDDAFSASKLEYI